MGRYSIKGSLENHSCPIEEWLHSYRGLSLIPVDLSTPIAFCSTKILLKFQETGVERDNPLFLSFFPLLRKSVLIMKIQVDHFEIVREISDRIIFYYTIQLIAVQLAQGGRLIALVHDSSHENA